MLLHSLTSNSLTLSRMSLLPSVSSKYGSTSPSSDSKASSPSLVSASDIPPKEQRKRVCVCERERANESERERVREKRERGRESKDFSYWL